MRRNPIVGGLLALLLAGCAAQAPNVAAGSAAETAAARDATPAAASPDRQALKAKVMEAVHRHDYQAAVTMEQSWARRYPDDLLVRQDEPMLYLLAGDPADWDRARSDLVATWARLRGHTPPPPQPGFVIDIFKIGEQTVVADQCYESAGRFGVLYRFDVTGPDHRLLAYFTVESPESDNQVARELGRKTPVFFLDLNLPGRHESAGGMDQLSPYAVLRQRVIDYMAKPNPVSASAHAGFQQYGCEFAQPQRRG